MPRLSIIIPALGNLPLMEQGLVSVLMHRPDDCEILVALNTPYADPYDLSDEVGLIDVGRGAGWQASVRETLAHCRAPIVHLLSPGIEVPEGWCGAAMRHFADVGVGAVAPVVVEGWTSQPHWAIAGTELRAGCRRDCRVREDRLATAEPSDVTAPSRAAMFVRRDVLAELLETTHNVADEWIDIELGLRLRAIGLSVRLEPAVRLVQTGPEPPVMGRLSWREACSRARQLEALYWRHAPQRGWAPAILGRVAQVLAGSVREARGALSARLVGRGLGLAEMPRERRDYCRAVARLKRRLDERSEKERVSQAGDIAPVFQKQPEAAPIARPRAA